MNEENKDTKLTGWQELGKTISDGIIGIATSITTVLSSFVFLTALVRKCGRI